MKTKILSIFLLLMFVLFFGGAFALLAGSGTLPDLVVTSIKFEKVKQLYDAQKNPYWLFNVYVTLQNQDKAPAGKFQMLLVRNIGEGGSEVQACTSCWPWVDGLNPGQYLTLGPFQFNNAGGLGCTFSAKADYPDIVVESNERNNTSTATFTE
jgi:hypothetical protein